MSDEIIIRRANERDLAFVTGLVPSLLEFGSPVWRDPDSLRSGFGAELARALRNQDEAAAMLIAQTEDETPLGFISLRAVDNIEGGKRGHVADLAIAENARRLGVGTALMKAGESWARERGFDLLSLEVWSSNEPALAFYRRLGYGVDSLTMIKRLGRAQG